MGMKDFEITYLKKEDDISKIHTGLSKEIVLLANEIIGSTDSYLVKCPYNVVIWDNTNFSFADQCKEVIDNGIESNNGIESINKPVGLVLHGVLEVTETFRNDKNIERVRSTALIRPGIFFGLFEAYADLYGYWRITSGITRILVTNPLSNETIINTIGITDGDTKATLRFSNKAKYDYTPLLCKAKERISEKNKEWYTSFLLFDSDKISGKLKLRLQSEAIYQLSSLVKQNPPESFINLRRLAPKHKYLSHDDSETNNVIATFDAILRGHIPVFRLADKNDNTLLPYDELIEVLRFDNKDVKKTLVYTTKMDKPIKSTMIPHVYIPDTICHDSKNVYLYVHQLSNKIVNIAKFNRIIRYLGEKKIDLLKNITVERSYKFKISSRDRQNIYCAIVTLPDHDKKDSNDRLVYTIYKAARVTGKKKEQKSDEQNRGAKEKQIGDVKATEVGVTEEDRVEPGVPLPPGIPLPEWFINKIVDKNGFMNKWPDHFSDIIIIVPGKMCASCKLSGVCGSSAHGNPASSKSAHHA